MGGSWSEREIRNCQGTEGESLTEWIEKVRSAGENYIVIWLRSVKLQSGDGR